MAYPEALPSLEAALRSLNGRPRFGAAMAPPAADGSRTIYLAYQCSESYTVPAAWAVDAGPSYIVSGGLARRPSPFAGRLVHYVIAVPANYPREPPRIDPAPWNALLPALLHPLYAAGVYTDEPFAGISHTDFGVPAGTTTLSAPLQYWGTSAAFSLGSDLAVGIAGAFDCAGEWVLPACQDPPPAMTLDEARAAAEARTAAAHDAGGARRALAALAPEHAAALRAAVTRALEPRPAPAPPQAPGGDAADTVAAEGAAAAAAVAPASAAPNPAADGSKLAVITADAVPPYKFRPSAAALAPSLRDYFHGTFEQECDQREDSVMPATDATLDVVPQFTPFRPADVRVSLAHDTMTELRYRIRNAFHAREVTDIWPARQRIAVPTRALVVPRPTTSMPADTHTLAELGICDGDRVIVMASPPCRSPTSAVGCMRSGWDEAAAVLARHSLLEYEALARSWSVWGRLRLAIIAWAEDRREE